MMSKNNKDKANIYTYPFATPAAMMLVMKDGGQQELLDQTAMHPDKNYNERVNAYINKVKQLAMNKVQEEMLEASTGYGEEADAIMSMIPMAQMGMQFSPQAYKTIDAFTQAAKPKNNMGKLFTNVLAPAMFSNAWDQNTDPLDKYYVKSSKMKDVTAKDLEKYKAKGKMLYGNLPQAQKGTAVQGSPDDEVVDNGDGTISVFSSDGTTRRYASKEQFKKLYKPAEGKKVQMTKELPTNLPEAGFTINPDLEAEASKFAFNKDTGKAERTELKPWDGKIAEGLEKRPVWQPEDGPSSPADIPAASQVSQNQNLVGDGLDWVRALIPGGGQRGAIMRGNEPEAFFAPNTIVAGIRGDYRFNPGNIFRSSEDKRPGGLKSVSVLFGDYDPEGGGIVPYGQSTEDYIPIIPNQTPGQQRREERKEARNIKREEKASNILEKATRKAENITKAGIPSEKTLQERLESFPTTGYSPQGSGYGNVKQRLDYLNQAGPEYQEDLKNELSSYGFKKGGALEKFLRKAQMGEEKPGDGLTLQQTLKAIQYNPDEYTGETSEIQNPTMEFQEGIKNPKEARYKLGSKNPYAAPAILAGMNFVAGALENKNAIAQQKELMNRLSFDQMSAALPGADGDYAFNTGMFRPNQMVPVQFTGYNNTMSQFGGAFEKDQEYYLDDNTIQAILAAGGEIEYLD